jgi:hypothetical protein
MDNLDKILDECIDRLNHGETVEACLSDYPEYSQRLRPLLAAMLATKSAYAYTPSAQARSAQRQRFNAALVASRERRVRRRPLFSRLSAWSKIWAATAAVIILALVGYFALRPTTEQPVIVAQPSPGGNFVFMISDEVNAIADFKELTISVNKVTVKRTSDEAQSVEFEPEIQTVNLAGLQGDLAQEIWRGDIPAGEYTKVFLEVSRVSGILLESGEEIEIKLPSGKLQISKSFMIENGKVTNFVYDLTVVKAGNSGQYILKPQVDQSGAEQDFVKVKVEPEETPADNGKSKGNKSQD